ncbi:MAG: mechanosensitive ion channel family protein [Pseudomonadota bacterium]
MIGISFVRADYRMTLMCLLLLWIFGSAAEATQAEHPLAPPDTSSPRATLKTFLDNMNEAVHAYRSGHREEAVDLAGRASVCLSLEKDPPALRHIMGFRACIYLKETLDRIDIPPDDEIPDAGMVRPHNVAYWTVPFTEITISAVKEGGRVERFLFTSDTVRNAEKYYNKVKHLPYSSRSEGAHLVDLLMSSGGIVLSQGFVDRLPSPLKTEIHGQAAWQWVGLVLYFFLSAGMVFFLLKYGIRALAILDERKHSNLKHTVGGLILPVTLILSAKAGIWFMVYGLHFINADAYVPIAFVFLIISYGAWIWLTGAVLNRLATVFVSIGGIVPGGVDDQLIRLAFQAITVIIMGVTALHLGDRLGLPTYSLITGLGIGGIAVALAGREALSNIIGTIMIILDRPFKLGDYIVLSEGERGEVAEVGLRSTRIRTRDDILISIPNSVIANAKMINESAPLTTSRMRIKLSVAYGSDLEKVERVLLEVADRNEHVLPEPNPRIRFRDFGDSALNFELLCWIDLPELRGPVAHQLNWDIHEEFRKHGIEMPFPQRDIHIRRQS